MNVLNRRLNQFIRRGALALCVGASLFASLACGAEQAARERLDSLAADYATTLETESESGWARFARSVTQVLLFEFVRNSPCESLALQLESHLTDSQTRAILVELQKAGEFQPHAAVWLEGGGKRHACGAAIRLPETLRAATKTAGGEFGVSGGGAEIRGRLTVFYSTAELDSRVSRLREHHGLQ